MKIKTNFNLDIEPKEWLYIAVVTIIILLLINGDISTAIQFILKLVRAEDLPSP
jgi:hypothetical protein